MSPLGPAVRLTATPTERLFHLVFEPHDGRALGADSEEKHEPASDIDTAVADSLKALDLKQPIREADATRASRHVRKVPKGEVVRHAVGPQLKKNEATNY